MEALNEVIKQLNSDLHQNKFEINTTLLDTLRDIKIKYRVEYSFFSLVTYYKLQLEKIILLKRKCILFNNYDKAAECRGYERYYIEKIKVLKKKNNEASEFFIEDNYIVFCYNKEDKIDHQITEILLVIM